MLTLKPACRSRSSPPRRCQEHPDHTGRSQTASCARTRLRAHMPPIWALREPWLPSSSRSYQSSATPRLALSALPVLSTTVTTVGRAARSSGQEMSVPSHRATMRRAGRPSGIDRAAKRGGRRRRSSRGASPRALIAVLCGRETCPNREFAELFDRFITTAHHQVLCW